MPGTGLVLSGGGARAAYEAGVLAELLPVLEDRGERPQVIVGTSAGALNAAFLAASAHLPAREAAAALQERMGAVTKDRVLKPVLSDHAPRTAIRYAAEIAGLPGFALRSLLDPGPLERTLRDWIEWNTLHRNLDEGAVEALAVVATDAANERAVVFVERDGGDEPFGSREVDYVAARIGVEHVMASSAIPTIFPAVRIENPEHAAGWYYDGGTRLNAPIKPAIDLGIDRVLVIGTHSVGEETSHLREDQPRFIDGAQQLLQATLVDPLIRDVRMLGKLNLLLTDGGTEAMHDYKSKRGKAPYRRLPYAFVGPRDPGEIGELASRVYRERFGGLKALRAPDLTVITRLLGGPGEAHGELLSYLLFDPEFIAELMELGRRDARAWLERVPGCWVTDPIDAAG